LAGPDRSRKRVCVLLISLLFLALGQAALAQMKADPALSPAEGDWATASRSIATGDWGSTWELLSRNQFEEALEALGAATDTSSGISRGFVLFAQGQEEQAAETWLQVLSQPEPLTIEEWEGLLFFLDQIARRVDLDATLLESYGRILKAGERLSIAQRLAMARRVWRLAARLGRWEEAEQAAGLLGRITTWQWVAGPFARFGPEDLQERFGPEEDPAAEEWSFEGWTTRRVNLSAPLRLGRLDFEDFLYPHSGVAYAFTQFEVEQGGPGTLSLTSNDSVRVWLNGTLLLEKNAADLQLARHLQASCRLRPGPNWILVKSLKSGNSWSFSLELRDENGEPWNIRPLPATPVSPPGRTDTSTAGGAAEGWVPPVLEALDRLSAEASPSAERLLLHWGLAVNYDAWPEAEAIAERLISSASSFALAHRVLGETYRMQAEQRPESRTRLEKQAQERFEQTLERFPADAMAAVEAARYHASRQTWDEAKRVLEACLEQRESRGLPVPCTLWIERGRVHRQKQFWIEARRDYARALELFPGKGRALLPMIGLLNESEGERAAFEYLKEGLQRRLDWEALQRYIEQGRRTGREEEPLRFLDDYLEGWPLSRKAQLERAKAAMRQDNWNEALLELDRLTEQCPADPEPYFQMAQLHLLQRKVGHASRAWPAIPGNGSASARRTYPQHHSERSEPALTQAREAAALALQKALQRAPESIRIRETLRQLELEQSRQPEIAISRDWYTPYDVQVEEIDEEALARLPQRRAGAVYLIDSSVMEIFPNGTARTQVHQAILLKNKEGRERFAEITIPGGDGVRLLWARTYSPDRSQTYEPTSIQDLGSHQAISMFNLEDGSIIDFAYEETASRGLPPGRNFQSQTFYFGGEDDPMLLSRFAVRVPPGLSFHAATHPADFAPRIEEATGATLYLWERHEVEGIKSEPFQPPLSEIVDTVRISTTPDFLVGQRAARSTLLGRQEKMEAIEAVASLLALDLEERDEKIDTVYNYVQERIEESGQGGRTIYDTYFTGSGGALERALLAQALLGAMGLRSEVAFSYDPRWLQGLPSIPTPHYLSGTLLYVPAEDPSGSRTPGHLRDRWIDFSSRYQPPEEIHPRLSQTYAMVLRRGGEFFTVPDPGQSPGAAMASEVRFQLEPQGAARVEGLLTFLGAARAALRQQMTNPDLRQRLVDVSIGHNLRGIQVEQTEVFGENQLADHLAFAFEGRIPQLLRPAGERYLLTPVLDPASMSDLVRDATREHPLEFTGWAKWMPYFASVRLPSGSGWTFLEVPQDTVLVSEFGVYSLIFRVEGGQLDITRSLIVPPQRIEPKDYARFAEFCRQVDGAEKRDIVIGGR